MKMSPKQIPILPSKATKTFAAVLAIAAISCATSAFADTYKIDPVHSTAIFKAKHMNTSNVYGRFNDVTGTVTLDEKDPSKSGVDITIKADSVDTNNEQRNTHLKSPSFLNTKEFPTITFNTTKLTKTSDNKYEAEGEVDLHGVKKTINATIEKIGAGKDMKGHDIIGGETHFTIKRSDFGITFMPNGVSDEIEMTVSVEADKQ